MHAIGRQRSLLAICLLLGTTLGCQVIPSASAHGDSTGAVLNNPTLNLGTVAVGQSSVLTDTLSNPTASNITLGQPVVAGAEFKVLSPAFPLTLSAGQQTGLSISFNPTSAGKASAVITFPVAGSTTPITLAVEATAAGPGALGASPSSISFGNVVAGQSLRETEVFTNTGGSDITVSQVTITGSQFQLSGPAVPITLAAGQSASCSVTFAPTDAGSATGNISVTMAQASATADRARGFRSHRFGAQDSGDQTATIAVSGTGVAPGTLTTTPSLSFPSVTVGTNETQTVTLTNSGGSALTVSQASLTGAAFSLSGVSLPIALPAGQSASLNVVFSPRSAGTSSGAIVISSTATDPTVTIALSGTAIAPSSLTALHASLGFGSVQTGTSQSLSETLTNSGGSSLTLSQATITGSFSTTGLSLPLTLAPGQTTGFSVNFAPSAAGSASASLSITTTSSPSPLTISLSGTGTSPGTLVANPPTLSFASVAVGSSGSQPETLTNTGGSNLTVSQATLTGTGFTLSGLSLPVTLAPEQSVSFNAVFEPQASGAAAGTLTIVSTASDASLTIALSASATTSGQLSLSPSSSSFGSVTVGANKSLTATLTATGASVTLSSASTSSAEFGVSGVTFPLTLAAGQSASFSIVFTPQSSGAASATLSFLSNASNSPAVESATGTGTAPPQHQVELSWTDASSGLAGYNIYRSQVSGGPYAKLNSALEAASAYTDTSVTAGQTYYYVTTAVDSTGTESTYSNQATALIPTP